MKEDYEEQIRILQESTRIPISTSVPSVQQMNTDFSQYHRGYVQSLQQLQRSISSSDTNCIVLMNNVVQQTTQLNVVHNNQIERQKKELTNAFQTQMNIRKEVHDEECAKLKEHYDNLINSKNVEIERLKQQKRDMVQIVEKKLHNLQYTHEKEMEKERNIVAMLQQNLQEQKDVFVEQMSDRRVQSESLPKEKQRDNRTSEKEENAQLKIQLQNLSQVNRQIVAENEKLKKAKNNLEEQIMNLSDQIVQISK